MQNPSAAPTSAAPSVGITVTGNPGIAATLTGNATATGTSTNATGNVTNTLHESPNGVTVASGEADFTAQGTGPDATATASSGVNVTGADYVFEITINGHGGSSTGATAESTTKYIAIDIPGYTPPGGEVVVDKVINLPYLPSSSGSSGLTSGANTTHATVSAEAVGPDPVAVGVEASHTVSGQLSSLTVGALVAD